VSRLKPVPSRPVNEAGVYSFLNNELLPILRGLFAVVYDLITAGTYTDGDTTPSVLGIVSLHVTNSGATTMTTLDDGEEGQVVFLTFADANTLLLSGGAGGSFYLTGGVNMTSAAGMGLPFKKVGANWWQCAAAVTAAP
jgi:hypothetical protein